jgi:subtilase family serine protease
LPDLFIASEHIAPSSINPIQNELIDLNATYFNLGNVPSGPFTVALYADDEFLVDTIVDSVEPGEEASVGWLDIYSTDVPGIHILKVVLDENGQLDEVNELNNVATRDIIVGDAPDFELTDVILSRIYPAIGEPIEITANIQNNGDAGAEAVLSVYYITMNDTIQIYTGSFYISKYGSTIKTVQWFAQVEEGYILTEITGSNPPEVNLANNSLVRYFGDEIKVVNPIPDVEVYEDAPLFDVADLAHVFENVDETVLAYTFETEDTNIHLTICHFPQTGLETLSQLLRLIIFIINRQVILCGLP